MSLIEPWIEGGVILTAGQSITGSFRGFHALDDATVSSITVTNVKDYSGALITSLPVVQAGIPFYGNITAIALTSGSIELW